MEPLGVCVEDMPLLRVVVGVFVLLGVCEIVCELVILLVCVAVTEKDPVRLGVPLRLDVCEPVRERVAEKLPVLEGVPVRLGVCVGVPERVPVGVFVGDAVDVGVGLLVIEPLGV